MVDADAAGGLTPALQRRMTTLIQYAVEGGADAVQLSCSMYGPVAVDADTRPDVTVLASDQAMFDHIASLRPRSVGVIGSLDSATSDSAERLAAALLRRRLDVRIETRGRRTERARPPTPATTALWPSSSPTTAEALGAEVDLIVLAQYSLAPTLDAVQAVSPVPVLSPPHLAASTLARHPRRRTAMIALGCIADDFTGGTDVAAALRRGGMSVALLFGVPESDTLVPPPTRSSSP